MSHQRKRMREFTTRTIAGQQTLGELLAQRRAAMAVSLAEAGRQLNINPSYLEALETGAHGGLPGTVYAVAFLKSYAQLLNLDPEEAVHRYKSELAIAQHARGESTEQWRPVARAAWWHFMVPARLLRTAMLAVVLLSALTYLGFKVEAIVQPPFLTVTSPADELLTDYALLTVAGQVEVGSVITINGQEVLADAQGRFSTPLDLQVGVNLIKITARKNHSKETVVQRRVVLQERQ
ncbi:MAG: hypothetical protein G01um101431_1180 [Parcubacteria group bacterium Gr01-1014_31]|nr:MAG: hypothetical protein G01um101431_1180 [Parcubacteria group bacterium Gr01-1014_31]